MNESCLINFLPKSINTHTCESGRVLQVSVSSLYLMTPVFLLHQPTNTIKTLFKESPWCNC